MNDPKNKDEALQLMTSLAKSFGIKNGDYLQAGSDFNLTDKSDKQTICCLVWNEANNKYKKYMLNDTLNNIIGTRYYYGGQLSIKKNGNNIDNTIIPTCGDINTTNYNKPGYQTNYYNDISQNLKKPEPNASGNTYWKFSRLLVQNSSNNNNIINGTLIFTYYITWVGGREGTMIEPSSSNKSSYLNEITNVISYNYKSHTLHFQQILTFVPCFKV